MVAVAVDSIDSSDGEVDERYVLVDENEYEMKFGGDSTSSSQPTRRDNVIRQLPGNLFQNPDMKEVKCVQAKVYATATDKSLSVEKADALIKKSAGSVQKSLWQSDWKEKTRSH